MMTRLKTFLQQELQGLKDQNLFKHERVIESAQGAEILVSGVRCLNFCANNYLGLSSHPELVQAAHEGIERRGFGLSSVRFICGTQDLHKTLESKVANFVGMEDAILFSSCFDANGAVFEPLFTAEDAIITDALNHASIIDGIRLSKAQRWIFNHADMRDVEESDATTGKVGKGLERCLREARDCRFRVIVTDGVFSMDGDIAKLKEICDLAERYDALVLVDDSHASGFMGKTGRGTHEHCGVMGRVDIITTTFGKALGGASGGCVAASKEVVAWLRNKGRPYLFSNTMPPAVVSASIRAIDLLSASTELRDRLESNAKRFRSSMIEMGFDVAEGQHPIVPVMFGRYKDSSRMAVEFANEMLNEGIYVIAFSFPVVPRGRDRIRVQISADHSPEHINRALAAFAKVGKKFGII